MAPTRAAIASGLLAALISAPSADQAQERPMEWRWLSVWPNADKNWTVDQGVAEIAIRGHKFSASLNNGEVRLKGTISGNRVVAIETVIGTEVDPFTVRGDIQRIRTRLSDASNGWGWDRISLTAPGGFYLGLYRKVRSGAKPDR